MRITILGSNFAALEAIKTLRKKDPGRQLELTVLSPKPQFLYYPSLIWIPSGERNGSEIVADLSGFFQRMGVHHHQAEATGIRDKGRIVTTADGAIHNDALLIASGGTYLRKLPGIEHTINPCAGIPMVETVRDRLQQMSGGTIAFGFAGNPVDPQGVRGGPMFEYLFGMHTHLLRTGRRDRFNLVFFSPMAEPGKRLGPRAVQGLLSTMAEKKIATRLGEKILGFTPSGVTLEGGELAADLTLFIPGMGGLPWYAETGFPLSAGGFITADAHCRVTGHERVYVAGDAASLPGPEWRAKQAHMAELQARAAAANLYDDLMGKPGQATFRNELICIVDSLNSGMLVSRLEWFDLILPPLRLMHWVKQFLEYKSLRPYT
ncbi:MAG: FAD-dependent oxidoreductase [Magnetococcales bacterium]|nr:FAD-dependent oxidoreductase [Magnetococcales bacterium]